jgi:RNA polymerase primary sigma factor
MPASSLTHSQVLGVHLAVLGGGRQDLVEELVGYYSPLVLYKGLRQAHRLGEEVKDLIQELYIELLKVLTRPLPGRKHLSFWVEVALDRKVREHFTQSLGASYRENRQLRRLTAVRLSLGQDPSDAELAEALGISLEELENLLALERAREVLSLSSPHPETGILLEEMVASEESDEDFSEYLENCLQKARLGLPQEKLETLDRFLADEEVSQDELEALARAIRSSNAAA